MSDTGASACCSRDKPKGFQTLEQHFNPLDNVIKVSTMGGKDAIRDYNGGI